MIADDVETVGLAHAGERMQELRLRRPELVGARIVEGRDQARLRLRIAGGVERDVVAALDETLDEQMDDGLGAAVALRRHGEPWRRENRNAQHFRPALAAEKLVGAPSRAHELTCRRHAVLQHLLHYVPFSRRARRGSAP